MVRAVVARADEVAPGEAKAFTVEGREIAVFNLDGEYFALSNRCPHEGGPLACGRIVGLFDADEPGRYRYSPERRLLKCPWHGWEFDVRTGRSWCDPRRLRAQSYAVSVAHGADLVEGPYTVETFPIAVDDDYLVVET